jgi:hypothetical protein
MLVIRIEHHTDADRQLFEKIGAGGRVEVAVSAVRGQPLWSGEHKRPPTAIRDVNGLDAGASRPAAVDRRPSEHKVEL